MAISYDTRTFLMLTRFMHDADSTVEILRIDPKDFIMKSSDEYQYINLVSKDFQERKLISKLLDDRSHDRFSYIDTEYKATRVLERVGYDVSNMYLRNNDNIEKMV